MIFCPFCIEERLFSRSILGILLLMIIPSSASKVKSSLTSVDFEKNFDNEEKLRSCCGKKRTGDEMIDGIGGSSKNLKMDPVMAEKCLLILKKLTKHLYGLCFEMPVDPVAYDLPNYFSIISKPMDLGTIESKLEKGMYATVEEFEADIRLTFSNAMRYHPPEHAFHTMAKQLNSKFSAEWSQTEISKPEALDNGKLPPKKRSRISDFTVTCGRKSSVKRIPTKSTKKTGTKRNNSERLCIRPTKNVSSLTTSNPPTNPTLEKIIPGVANTTTPLKNLSQKTVPKAVNTHKPCDNYANDEDLRSPACGIPMSPVKAMRTEMLKERFANIISKAQNQIYPLGAQIKSQQKTNCSVQRQLERKAARLAIEKIEKSVEFEDNLSSLRCLENMIGHFSIRSPLEGLGLYLKDEYQHGDEQCTLPQDYEEGEIIC